MFIRKANFPIFGSVNKEAESVELSLKKAVEMQLVLTHLQSYTQRHQLSLISLAKFLKIGNKFCYFKEKMSA